MMKGNSGKLWERERERYREKERKSWERERGGGDKYIKRSK